MTRKDYVLIAAVLAEAGPPPMQSDEFRAGAAFARDYAAHKLAAMLARDNPRFNRARFLAACGVAP